MASQAASRAVSQCSERFRASDHGQLTWAGASVPETREKKIKTNFQPQPPEYFLSCLGLLATATTSTTSTACQLKCVNMAD